jgi:hypothetical protein
LNIDVKGGSWTVNFDHTHPMEGETDAAGAHRHAFWADGANAQNDGGFKVAENPFDTGNSVKVLDTARNPIERSEEHSHGLENVTIGAPSKTTDTIPPDSEPFVVDGTAAIDLLLLGVDLLPGAHTLEFSVPPGKGGGKLFYELYVD